MSKKPMQKPKLLYLVKFLSENTDEYIGATVEEMIAYLAEHGISAERKSIYADIETLIDFGYDIFKNKSGRQTYYHLGEREFQLAELKLLVDAVQCSKFITERQSDELIRKLEKLTGPSSAEELRRQVIVSNRVKSSNKSIYYNIDSINEAIRFRRKISFFYTEYVVSRDTKKKIVKRRRHDGKRYLISPKALSWDDENYYLVGYDGEEDLIKHFRVDKMESITVTDEKAQGSRKIDKLDMAVYSKQVFGMFGGEIAPVKLKVKNSLVGVIVDRFSDKVFLSPLADGTFHVTVDVMLSPPFFGWIASFGGDIRIVSPKAAKEKYLAHLRASLEPYEGN